MADTKEVKVFTTSRCPNCMVLKSYLRAANISFEEINLENKPELVSFIEEKTGRREVPVVQIDNEFIVGLDIEKVKNTIG